MAKEFKNEKSTKKVTAEEWSKMPQAEWLMTENYVDGDIRYHELMPSGVEAEKVDTLKDLKAEADSLKIKYPANIKREELKELIEKSK